MCGLGAIIKKQQSYLGLQDDILKIATILHHRGPDAFGLYEDEYILLQKFVESLTLHDTIPSTS